MRVATTKLLSLVATSLRSASETKRTGAGKRDRLNRSKHLSPLRTLSERGDDAIQTELASRQWLQIVTPPEVSAGI